MGNQKSKTKIIKEEVRKRREELADEESSSYYSSYSPSVSRTENIHHNTPREVYHPNYIEDSRLDG